MIEYSNNKSLNIFIKKSLEKGLITKVKVSKNTKVFAKKGNIGDKIITWNKDTNDKEIKEKINTIDNNNCWIMTEVDKDCNVIIDKNGHPRQWITSDKNLKQNYKIDIETPFLCCLKNNIETVIKINNTIFNITDENNIYKISQNEFDNHYTILPNKKIKTKRLNCN